MAKWNDKADIKQDGLEQKTRLSWMSIQLWFWKNVKGEKYLPDLQIIENILSLLKY